MKNKVQFVTSKLLNELGLTHGWFMRYGGVSTGSFDSLNGKKGSGDSDANVTENRQRAARALGSNGDTIAHIVHAFKNQIAEIAEPGEYSNFDAAITKTSTTTLSQTTADCASVIVVDQSKSVLGLIHGSWHTLNAHIIEHAVEAIRKHTNQPLRAAIGPMICQNCYEYGPEAANLFGVTYLQPIGSKYLVNLKQMVIDQLQSSGVRQIDDLNICTLEDERFFSHRRSGAGSGRFLTLVSLS